MSALHCRYVITKDFAFEAAHSLPYLPAGHKCARLHGHSYRVRVTLGADVLDDDGFVEDYGDLDAIGEFLRDRWDHQDLNELAQRGEAPRQTTAESLARWLFTRFRPYFPNLRRVSVSETAKTWAHYQPHDDPIAVVPDRPLG